jgi:glycosyltransferase involved in cell wall biosynthesis
MGFKQGLENIVACAQLAQHTHPELLFVLMGDGNQRAELEARATGLSNLRFFPPQPEERFSDALAAADILLVNQRPSVTDMSLPGKLTSYFAVGRPVVAAVAPASETAAELQAAGAGMVVPAGAPDLLLGALHELSLDPERASALGQRGLAYARDHLTAPAALARLEAFVRDVGGWTGAPALGQRVIASAGGRYAAGLDPTPGNGARAAEREAVI